MSHTSFASFSHAAEQAQPWVNELARDLCLSEPSACPPLGSVLHTVRDWLSQAEMADFSTHLPVLFRGIHFEGWNPSAPARERNKRDFVLSVSDNLGYDEEKDFDVAINTLFKLRDRHISHGEIVQVRNSMKKSLRKLWPVD